MTRARRVAPPPLSFLANSPPPLPVSFDTDQEKITQNRYGQGRSSASFGNTGRRDCLVVTTTMPTAAGVVSLVEVRQLHAGGLAHTQV